jgi:hypothetical protein
MLAGLRYVLTSSVTGPVATAIAVALAFVLGIASSNWEAQRTRYEARISELTQASERVQASLRTQLAACHAVGDARRLAEANYAAKRTGGGGGARRLLEQQPEGIDACARMESADQAVLSNLKK